MPDSARFDRPSGRLMLRALLRRTQSVLWVGLGLALATHAAFSQWRGMAEQRRLARPLTTQFVKRQPRLTKPLELKKRPKPRTRQLQRQMVAVKAKLERGRASAHFQPTHVLRGLVRPSAHIGRMALAPTARIEPAAFAGAIEGAKEIQQKVDMALELLNVDALDTGQYHALIVQDPLDKRNIRGFLHLAVVYSRSMYPPKYPMFEVWIAPVMPRLAEAMNKYTHIRTDILGKFSLDSAEIFEAPWLYFMAFWPFDLSHSELDNLGRYMLSGGFVFADSRFGHSPWRGGALSVSSTILQAMAMQGFDLSYEKLPGTHAIYHCFFDFDGPPGAGDTTSPEKTTCGCFTYLEGVSLETRLLAVFSKKGYYQPWAAWQGVMREHKFDNTRPLQFGVNTIIFALTQEGSITHRLMESVQ